MLKIFTTLVRGAAAAADEEMMDCHALLILDQQIRDVASGVERSKRALALAIAQDEAEGRRLAAIEASIADLEERAVAALQAGRDDLAGEAAQALAALEADRNAVREARAVFAAEVKKLRHAVTDASRRLAALERGRRIAQAAEAVRRLKTGHTGAASAQTSALTDAEATLKRLRERQAEAVAAEAALDAIDEAADSIAEKLEAEGFGPRTKPTASAVLERLRRKAAASTATAV